MSHFTVLVVGEDPEKQLAPFHEFECTGNDDEYVVEIDETEECVEKYEADTSRMLKAPDGELRKPYDDEFYRDPTEEELKEIGPLGGTGCCKGFSYTSKDWGDGKGYRAKISFVPEGYEEVTVPTKELQTLLEYAEDYYGYKATTDDDLDISGEHKYGYVLVDAEGNLLQVVNRTNPNRKWDWYQLGGRWCGYFALKPEGNGVIGPSGTFGNKPPEGKRADTALLKDIDLDLMLTEEIARAEKAFDKWEAALEEDREKAERAAYFIHGVYFKKEEDRYETREEFLARRSSIATFAVLKDGEWHEQGSMGWWGCVGNEKDSSVWDEEFNKLLRDLPEDTRVSVYDCHI